MLATKYNKQNHNVIGWVASEKYDGIRAFWDGQNMTTRGGKTIYNLPDMILKVLPTDSKLDGELTMGRGKFTETMKFLNSQTPKTGGLRYYVFDNAKPRSSFRERIDQVEEEVKRMRKRAPKGKRIRVHAVKQIEIKSHDHLKSMMRRVLRDNGEGLILRDPDSLYVNGRSNKMLKLKPIHSMNAVVVGHKP